jgi:rhodanese-related sulfurtransferase
MIKKSAAEMVQDAKGRTENLDVNQVEREMAQGEALIVDIREASEVAATGMIPGAVAVPRGMLEFIADPESPMHDPKFVPDRRIILHCAAGGRSALAAETLKGLGFSNVAHLDGGMTAWAEAGKPVEKDETWKK